MKKMSSRMMITVLAAAITIAFSGCAANETKTAYAAGTSAVSAHETTGETAPAAATEKAIEVSVNDMTENRGLTAVGTAEIDVSQLMEDEKDEQSENTEEENNDHIAPDDTSEGSEEPEDEEEEPEDEEEDEDNDGLYLDDSSEYIDAFSPADDGVYPCSVILVCTSEDTTAVMIEELISKYDLGIVYDYNNFNMYAFSTPEPLDKEATKKLIDELTSYDFILSAEPDRVIYLDDPVMPSPEINGPTEL